VSVLAHQHLHLHSQYSVFEVDERIGLQYMAISGEINFRIGCTATSGPAAHHTSPPPFSIFHLSKRIDPFIEGQRTSGWLVVR
jgi:hypothetical protein